MENAIEIENKKTLNDIFDKIYVIHCAENTKRMKNIEFQLKNNPINMEIWWTCYHAHSDVCANALLFSNKGRSFANGKEFNLTREFYGIIKTSYLRGFEKILIFEDDFALMKSEYLQDFVENMPEDFDILQFGVLFNRVIYDGNDIQKEFEKGNYFIRTPFGAWGNCGLALSRKGMKYFIDFIDNEFVAADIPTFEANNKMKYYGKVKKNDLKCYIPTVPLVYLTDDNLSQVQEEDRSYLYEYYQMIDTKFYNIYDVL